MMQSRAHRIRRGLTLVEVMLGLVVTVMAAGGAMTMFYSVNRATQSQESRRQVIMRRFLLSNRLSATLRSSECVLAAGADYLVLWRGDSDGDGQPNLAELQRIQWTAGDAQLWSYSAPASLPSADNMAYDLTADFNAVTAAVTGGAKFPGDQWATGVSGLAITLDNVAPASAEVVRISMTLTADNVSGDLLLVNRVRQLQP